MYRCDSVADTSPKGCPTNNNFTKSSQNLPLYRILFDSNNILNSFKSVEICPAVKYCFSLYYAQKMQTYEFKVRLRWVINHLVVVLGGMTC